MEPVRTCVGCRQRASNLLRIVLDGQELVPDLGGKLPGRGARLHTSTACLKLAIDRKAFSRALRVSTSLQWQQVANYVEQAEKMLAS
ncbi:MAG: hypothetical protein RL508_935 [Actinomycetota bacterium]|jgi:predicted RNA-binding protein YlxR (DUF448 family)